MTRSRPACCPVSLVRDGDFHLDEFLTALEDRYGDHVYFVTRGPDAHVASIYRS